MDTQPLAEYRANFTSGTILTPLTCVRAVTFPSDERTPEGWTRMQNRISVPAQLEILSACADCDALLEARLDGDDGTGGTVPLIAKKRDDTAKALRLLPRRISILNVDWGDDSSHGCFDGVTQILYVVSIPPDKLSRALHKTSMQLRELHMAELDAMPEIFSLSDDENEAPVLWPHLEILRLIRIPTGLPNRHSLIYNYTRADENGRYDAVALTPWKLPGKKRLQYFDHLMSGGNSIVPGSFDELYTAAGQAAQKMPSLKNMLLSFEKEDVQDLGFDSMGDRRVLGLSSLYGYSPTQEVLDAWRVPDGRKTLHFEVLKAVFDSWPPA